MCVSVQNNLIGSTNYARSVLPEEALETKCHYCSQPMFAPIARNGQSGAAECVNKTCRKTKFLLAQNSAYPTLRCACGFRDFLANGGGSLQRLICDHCAEDVVLPRIIGKRV